MSDFRDAVHVRELARRCFSAETEGELTFGSPAAFAADSVWRGFRAKQSNTPSVSRQKQAADTSLGEGGCKGKVKRKVKQLFIFYPLKAKPLFKF